MMLYTNGCSHTFGAELPNKGPVTNQGPSPYAWPSLLASHLNMDLMNGAVPGTGIEYITTKTITEISMLMDDIVDAKDIMVVILLPHRFRTFIPVADRKDKWMNLGLYYFKRPRTEFYSAMINQGCTEEEAEAKVSELYDGYGFKYLEAYTKYIDFDAHEAFQYWTHVHHLQSFFKLHDIEYYFHHAQQDVMESRNSHERVAKMTQMINMDYFMTPHEGYLEYCYRHHFKKGVNHYLEDAHESYAKHWCDYIQIWHEVRTR